MFRRSGHCVSSLAVATRHWEAIYGATQSHGEARTDCATWSQVLWGRSRSRIGATCRLADPNNCQSFPGARCPPKESTLQQPFQPTEEGLWRVTRQLHRRCGGEASPRMRSTPRRSCPFTSAASVRLRKGSFCNRGREASGNEFQLFTRCFQFCFLQSISVDVIVLTLAAFGAAFQLSAPCFHSSCLQSFSVVFFLIQSLSV